MRVNENGDGSITIVLETMAERMVMLNEAFLPVFKRAMQVDALQKKFKLPMCGQPDCPDCVHQQTTLSMGESFTRLADEVVRDVINKGNISDEMAKQLIAIIEGTK